MTNKEFAFLNCIDEKKADQILNWFVENFDEKDIVKLLLVNAVIKSAATVNYFHDACIEIKKEFPDFCDIWILEDLSDLANRGINVAKAGKEITKTIKKIKNHENLD